MVKVTARDFTTEKLAYSEILAPAKSWVDSMSTDGISGAALQERIDSLEISAEAKLFLGQISGAIVSVGNTLIAVGKKLVQVALYLAHQFPMAGLGVILGLLLGALVSSIPILGFLLGPLVGPIAAAFGLVKGAIEDFKNKELQRKIQEAVALYEPLRGEVHAA